MKKLYILFLLASSVLVCIMSCQKNKESAVTEEPKVEVATEPHIVTLSVPYPALETQTATKVFMDPADGKSYWEVGDKIVIYGKPSGDTPSTNYIVHSITAPEITNPAIAVITEDISAIEAYAETGSIPHKYNAAYPADDWYFYSHWTGNGRASFNNTNQILMAGYVSDELDAIKLFNLNAVIAFKVSGDFDSYNFMGNNGDEIVGYTHYLVEMNVASPDYRLKHNTDMTWGTFGDQYSISGPVNGDGETYNFVYIPYKAELPDGFTIQFKKDGNVVKYVTSTEGLTIEPGHYVDLGLIPDGAMHDYVAPTGHNATHPAIDGATDLGASATANCYIVDASVASNAGNVFKFKAVKGNSSTNVGAIASVSVLWETYNNATDVEANSVILEADFDKQDSNDYYEICFKMPETLHAGNAVIAAKDDSDNILWSWHIWVPETVVSAADYGIHTSGKNVMDRNLGALKVAVANPDAKIDVTSVGLVYQWGRKDPFPGPRSIETEGEYVSFARVAGTSPSAEKRQLSLLESIQSPTVFARGLYDGSTLTNNNWLNETDNTLWGDESSKTIYDPCPAGYRVPNRDKDASLWSGSSITSKTGWSFNASNYWFTLGSPATVFPAAGYCDGGSFKVTFRTVLWNAHADGDNDQNAYNIYVYSGPSGANYSHVKNRGYYVRCVAE